MMETIHTSCLSELSAHYLPSRSSHSSKQNFWPNNLASLVNIPQRPFTFLYHLPGTL